MIVKLELNILTFLFWVQFTGKVFTHIPLNDHHPHPLSFKGNIYFGDLVIMKIQRTSLCVENETGCEPLREKLKKDVYGGWNSPSLAQLFLPTSYLGNQAALHSKAQMLCVRSKTAPPGSQMRCSNGQRLWTALLQCPVRENLNQKNKCFHGINL